MLGLAKLWGKPIGRGHTSLDDWVRAWENIRVLAGRLHSTIDAGQRCDGEAFNSLLLAVGNFKRQSPIHLEVDLARLTFTPAKEIVLPTGLGRIGRKDVGSWQRLQGISGVGMATATCLLAALWPDYHATMDVLDSWAAVGLQVGQRSKADPRLDAALMPSDEWQLYEWFRRTVTLTAEVAHCEPVEVERALFVIGKATARALGRGWRRNGTWSSYHQTAVSQIGRLVNGGAAKQ